MGVIILVCVVLEYRSTYLCLLVAFAEAAIKQ